MSGLLAFQANRGDPNGGPVDRFVATVASDGSGVELLGPGVDPAISPNAKLIVFARLVDPGNPDAPIELFTISAQGGGTRQLTRDGAANRQPALSDDARQIAFTGLRPGVQFTQIFNANGDGSGERALTNGFSADTEPSFAPAGHRIVFVRGPGNSKLVSMKSDGTDAVYLTKDSDPFELPKSPHYSPDHKRIVFSAVEAGSNRIYTIDGDDGSGFEALTDRGRECFEPAYSPDGATIVYREGVNLFTMAADGSGSKQLTDLDPQEGQNVHPSWGASDPRR